MKCATDPGAQLDPAPSQLLSHTYRFTFYFVLGKGFPPLKGSLNLRHGHAVCQLLEGELGGAGDTARTKEVLWFAGED